jgi:hypothetical protein
MKSNKLIALTLCIAFFATSNLFSQNETKNRNIAISNAYLLAQKRNIQLEFERKIRLKTSLGLYAQFQNFVVPMFKSYEYDFLPKGGFMDNGTSFQAGLQIARHFLKPESKWDFWLKWRAGVNISNRFNFAGNYWYWNPDREKERYTIAERQYKVFGNFETNFGIGLSRQISDKFSVFLEPAFNCQLFLHDYRANQRNSLIAGYLSFRYGVSYSF